jgi:DNA-directed RNA polymerase subunit beta
VKKVEVIDPPKVPFILNSLAEDNTSSHEEALLRIYQRLRPGNPPQLGKGAHRCSTKSSSTSTVIGWVASVVSVSIVSWARRSEEGNDLASRRFDRLIQLLGRFVRILKAKLSIDDIDHLGNRRLRTIDELAATNCARAS